MDSIVTVRVTDPDGTWIQFTVETTPDMFVVETNERNGDQSLRLEGPITETHSYHATPVIRERGDLSGL